MFYTDEIGSDRAVPRPRCRAVSRPVSVHNTCRLYIWTLKSMSHVYVGVQICDYFFVHAHNMLRYV